VEEIEGYGGPGKTKMAASVMGDGKDPTSEETENTGNWYGTPEGDKMIPVP
jgi:hypothetical protein